MTITATTEPNDRRAVQLRTLTETSRALTNAVSLDEVLDLAVRRATELLDGDTAVLMMVDGDGVVAERASSGDERRHSERFVEPFHETVISRLETLLGASAGTHVVSVPLVAGGEVTGLLAVSKSAVSSAPEEDEWLLSALADQASVAIEKIKLDETAAFRERLIGIVGHDLRNPLQAITVGSQLLLEDDMPEHRAKIVRRIVASALRMDQMISQLLDFTRSRLGGGLSLRRERTEINSVCSQVLEELHLAKPTAQLRLETSSAFGPFGDWDRERLSQALSNLVANAIQYGAIGRPVIVRTRTEDDRAIVDVCNEGEPIEPKLLPFLFDPFRRGDLTGRSSTSLGLGLHITDQIVRAHGGELVVVSSVEDGTRFTIRLPAERPVTE